MTKIVFIHHQKISFLLIIATQLKATTCHLCNEITNLNKYQYVCSQPCFFEIIVTYKGFAINENITKLSFLLT